MGEERLIILKLLEQGKITESEAEQLLDALGDMEYDQATQNASNAFNPYKIDLSKEEDSTYNEKKKNTSSNKAKDFEDLLESIGKRVESLGEQIEDKMDGFGEQFGKKMVTLGGVFADKSISFAEKIIDVVEKTVDSDTFANMDLFGNTKSYEEVIERKLSDIKPISLQFESYNGGIILSKWNEPMIKVTAYISAKEGKYDSNKPILQSKEEDGTICFFPKHVDWIGVKLKIQLPNQAYDSIKIKNKNGCITVDNLSCNKSLFQTQNASIQLNNVSVQEEINCTTTNNKIIIENSKGQKLLAVTKNGKILINNCNFKKVESLTSNNKITIRDIDLISLESMGLKTTNSKIEVFGSIPEGTGVQFDGNTTHGNININVPVVYITNIKNYSNHRINARTSSFDSCKNITFIKAYSTNGSIYFF